MQSDDKKTEAAQAAQSRKAWDARNQSGAPAHGRPKLTTPPACEYVREEHGIIISPRTLSNLAWAGRGPKFHKCAGRRYYDIRHLDEWALEQLGEPRQSTSDRPKVGG